MPWHEGRRSVGGRINPNCLPCAHWRSEGCCSDPEPGNGGCKPRGYVRSFSVSSLASGRNRSVGVLVPAVNRWYFSTVLEGITVSLLPEGYDLTLYNSGRGAHDTLFDDFLFRKRIDGVIVVGSRPGADEIDRRLEVRRPVVVVGGSLPGVSTIEIDDSGALGIPSTLWLPGVGSMRQNDRKLTPGGSVCFVENIVFRALTI